MAMDTSVPFRSTQTHQSDAGGYNWVQALAFLPSIRLFVFLLPCLLWGLCIKSSPPCSQQVLGAGGDELWTWEQQFLETDREINDRKHALWTSADIFQAEICPATHPSLRTHIAFRNTRSRQERQPSQARQANQDPGSYCGSLSEKQHEREGKRHRMKGALLPLLPTGSDTWRELLNCCVLLFSHLQDRNDDSRCLKRRE